jgi:hypothetical protein
LRYLFRPFVTAKNLKTYPMYTKWIFCESVWLFPGFTKILEADNSLTKNRKYSIWVQNVVWGSGVTKKIPKICASRFSEQKKLDVTYLAYKIMHKNTTKKTHTNLLSVLNFGSLCHIKIRKRLFF